MTYNWKEQATGDGPGAGPKMEPGYYQARIVKVIRGKKDGTLFESKGGDPQLMVIWENTVGEQAAQMLTLSHRAAFKLARLCGAVGMDLDRMMQAEIEPQHFANEEFARKQLMDRRGWVQVSEWGDAGKVEAEAVFTDAVPPQYLKQQNGDEAPHAPLTEDDIPF